MKKKYYNKNKKKLQQLQQYQLNSFAPNFPTLTYHKVTSNKLKKKNKNEKKWNTQNQSIFYYISHQFSFYPFVIFFLFNLFMSQIVDIYIYTYICSGSSKFLKILRTCCVIKCAKNKSVNNIEKREKERKISFKLKSKIERFVHLSDLCL